MAGRVRISGGARDHLLTFLAEGAVLVATVLVYKLAADRLGGEGFERYTVVRRTVSFLQMIGLCGLAVGLVRSVAMVASPGRRVGLLRRATRRIAGVSVLVLGIAAVLPGPLALLFFGSADLAGLSLPIALLTTGLMLHVLVYGHLRGTHRMTAANMLQVLGMAVVPNAAMLVFGDLAQVLWATGSAWLVLSGAVLAWAWNEAPVERDPADERRMLRYGMLRLPGDVIFAGLLTLPVYLVNHVQGLSVGAQLAFGITLINVAGAAYSPLSLLLLPSAAGLVARRAWGELDLRIARVMRLSIGSALLLLAGFELLATPFLRAYLGEAGAAMEVICRAVFVGAFFYGVFVALRSVLDAYYTAPRNTFNLAWSFVLFLPLALLYVRAWPVWWMAALLLVVPLAVLFVLTWRDVRWVRADLQAKARTAPGLLHVLEPTARPGMDAAVADAQLEWTVAHVPAPRGPLSCLRVLRAVRTAEHRARPDLMVIREQGLLALLALFVARRPVVLVLGQGALRGWTRLAAWAAALVVCPSPDEADELRWRDQAVHVLDPARDGGQQLLHFLRLLHHPVPGS